MLTRSFRQNLNGTKIGVYLINRIVFFLLLKKEIFLKPQRKPRVRHSVMNIKLFQFLLFILNSSHGNKPNSFRN